MTIYFLLREGKIKFTQKDANKIGELVKAHFGKQKFPKVEQVEVYGEETRKVKCRDYPNESREEIVKVILEYFSNLK